jgi:hypothetical protein
VRTVAELLHDYQLRIAELRVDGQQRCLDVVVDGDVLFSKHKVTATLTPVRC